MIDIEEKWRPILENAEIPKKHIKKIAEYAEFHALYESKLNYPGNISFSKKDNFNLLPVSIKILKNVKDLSKIHFVLGPMFERLDEKSKSHTESVSNYSFICTLPTSEIQELKNQTGIDVIEKIENLIIEEVARTYNELIEKGNELYIYIVANSIAVISEGITAPKMKLDSRFYICGDNTEKTNKNFTITIDDL